MADKKAAGKPQQKHRFSKYKDYPHKESFSLPQHFSLVSAQTSPKHDDAAHESMKSDLKQHGFTPTETDGHYGHEEKSFLVPHKGDESDHRTIETIAWKHKQDAVLHSSDNKHKLVFKSGEPSWEGEGHLHGPFLDSHYTKLPSGHKISLILKRPEDVKKSDAKETYKKALKENIEKVTKIQKPHYYGKVEGVHVFHSTHESHQGMVARHLSEPSDQDLQEALGDAQNSGTHSIVIHGSPPPSLRSKALPAAHPHNYDWHDGHTDHYDDEGLSKDVGIPIPKHGNEQAAGAGVKSYKPIAEKFGSVIPGKKTNLQFYKGLEKAEPAIDHMIAKHGYQTYLAGGKEYPKPDLKNKNYNTGHLMVYNPKPESGGDFGHEEFTRSWRKLHELAHALTYKDVNNMYGEGRRLGKLGVRTPHEAKRAVHWEWMVAHKQRDLAKELGFHVSDHDFHRELNTVMHDAVHRAITGQFTEPSDEGFHPHHEPIPLETSLGMVDDAAKSMGLMHEHATKAGSPKAMPSDYPTVKLNKAFLQGDGETITQGTVVSAANASVPKALMAWGAEKLAPLAKDAIEVLELDGKVIKVRKLMEDLYSGWIEARDTKIHQFERVTLPELMQQIHSKLELYGREEEAVADKKVETAEEAKEEMAELNSISSKLKQLHDMVDRFKARENEEHQTTISAKELNEGIENPEEECPACEKPVNGCLCYLGLSKPRLEFDGKKVTIFFKSEWQENDRENFIVDLKRRAGMVLLRKKANVAREALGQLKKRVDGKGKK